MLRIVLFMQLVFPSPLLQAEILEGAARCLSPFTREDPETLFKEDGLFFSIDDFKSCSQDFLKDWDNTPKEITELPFLTAMHGLRAILAVTRYDEKEEIVKALYGKNLREKLEIMIEWLEEKTISAERQYIRFLSSTAWNPKEEEFFSFTNAILLGNALVKGIPAILRTYDPENPALHPIRFKKTFARVEDLDTKVRYLANTLAKKQILLFPERKLLIEEALVAPKSPYYPNGGIHMITGHIFKDLLSEINPSNMENIPLDDTPILMPSAEVPWTVRVKKCFHEFFRKSPSPYFYAYEEE